MNKIGRYVIISELGRGAMGIVYKASDPRIDREVALKVVSINAVPDQGLESPRDMFMREVRAAGRLSHPAIVTIHDAFDDKETQTSCIVMELVPGMTLEKILEAGHRLTVEQTLNLMRQVGDGLDYAHRNQVIHRDMKPANILVTQEGRAKITDFGIAKVLAREGAARTVGVMGTPSYMSPEQVKGGDVDARSDIFSLGIILFTMLTGKRPFVGNTAAVMFKIVYEEAATPSTVNTQLAPAFDHVVKMCLAKDRKNRYPSTRDLLNDLDDLQNGRPPRSQTTAASPEVGPTAGVDQTVAVSIPGLLRTQAPPSAPPPRPASPPVAPAQAGSPVGAVQPGRPVAPPQRPPAPPPKPAAPNPTPAGDLPATMAMPLSELLKSSAQPPVSRSIPAPPAAPVEPARPQPPRAPLAGAPLTGRTEPMPVPDLSGVSPPAPPRPSPLPPRREGPKLMERTQPMRVPDLSTLSAAPPALSPPTVPAPPAPTVPPLSVATRPTPPADLSSMPSATGAPSAAPPAPPAPVAPPTAWAPAAGPPTVSAPAPPQPVAPPVFVAPAPEPQPLAPPSYHPSVAAQPEEPTLVSASPQPAAKSKLVPAMVGGVATLLLVLGSWGIWKFRQSRTVSPAPPVQAAVQTPPAAPLPEATPPATPNPSPAPPVGQAAAPVNAAPPVTRKTAVRKTKAAAQQAVTSQPAPPPPQPQPAVATPAPAPAPPPPNPEAIAKAEAAKLANVPHIVNVDCNFGLKEATFTFSAGGKTIYEETFKGKKKKKEGFLGLKGSYQGSFSHTITVPAGASDVSLHVVAKEGADLSKSIKMPSPGGFIPTLTVDVDGEHLSLNWKGSGPGL